MKKKPVILKEKKEMTAEQYAVFLKYYALGARRSLLNLHEELHQESTKTTPKKKTMNSKPAPGIDTLKQWSRKHKWQDMIVELDEEATEAMYEAIVKEMRDTNAEMLHLLKIAVVKFANQLRQKGRNVTLDELKEIFRMQREALGFTSPEQQAKHAMPLGGVMFHLPMGATPPEAARIINYDTTTTEHTSNT